MKDKRQLPQRLDGNTDASRKTMANLDTLSKWVSEILNRLDAIEARLTAAGL